LVLAQPPLPPPTPRGFVGESPLAPPPLACLAGARRASPRLDRPANAHGLRLLRQRRRSRKRRDQGCARQQAPRRSTHVVPPKNGCVPSPEHGTHKTKLGAAHELTWAA